MAGQREPQGVCWLELSSGLPPVLVFRCECCFEVTFSFAVAWDSGCMEFCVTVGAVHKVIQYLHGVLALLTACVLV
jgi:hypothetical protein